MRKFWIDIPKEEELRQTIKNGIRRKDLNPKKLAFEAGWSYSYFNNWLNGVNKTATYSKVYDLIRAYRELA